MKKSKIYVDSRSYSILVVLGSVVGEAILCLMALWTEEANVLIDKVFLTIFFSAGAMFAGLLFAAYIWYLKDISQES